MEVPEEAKALLERATFVVSTLVRVGHRSVLHQAARQERAALGQDHLLPQSRSVAHAAGAFPDRRVGRDHPRDPAPVPEIGRVRPHLHRSARYKFRDQIHRGDVQAPIHGQPLAWPQLCRRGRLLRPLHPDPWAEFLRAQAFEHAHNGPVDGIVYPQWAVGFDEPFKDKIGVEFKDDRVVACTAMAWRPTSSAIS